VKPQPLRSLAAAALMLMVCADRASAQATAPRTAGGCPLEPAKFHDCALPKTKTFDPPRTSDGRPDMQGYWDRAFVDRFISPLASCLPPGIPRDIVAPAAHQIVQTPGYVMHLLEYSHSYRIIPTTGEPHVGSAIKLFQGNSRGRWEGNTLVVDVTNTNGLTWLDNAGNFSSDALHVVERFTLIDRDTIHFGILWSGVSITRLGPA
jgi:hypothetical protein